MDVLIIGSTGMLGRHLVAEALQRGHRVTAFVRADDRVLDLEHDRLRYFVGDALDPEAVGAAVAGHGAVLSAVGGRRTDVRRQVAEVLAHALLIHEVPRLIAVGGAGILQLDDERLLRDSEGFPRALQAVTADHYASWQILAESELDWTFVCPPMMRDEAGGGDAAVAADRLPAGHSHVAAGDVAGFILDELEDGQFVRRRVGIAEIDDA